MPSSSPICKLIGFKLIKAKKGSAICKMMAQKAHQNPLGAIHGGILCGLADATMGYAFLSHFPTTQKGVTVDLQISFMKRVRSDEPLKATAKTLSHGRSLYFMECDIKNGSGKLVAKASSTCKVLHK